MKYKRFGVLLASAVAGSAFVVGGPAVAAHAVDTQTCIPTVDYPQADGTVWASIYCPDGGIGRIDQNVYEDGNLVHQTPDRQCLGSTSVVFVNCTQEARFGTRTPGHKWCQVTWFLLSGGTDEERNCIYPDGHTDYYTSGWY